MTQKLEFLYFALKEQSSYVDFHKHECYELVYYINGIGQTKIGANNYGYSPHSFTIIEPDTLHDENHLKDTDVIFIGFRCNMESMPVNGIYTDSTENSILNYLRQMKQEILEKKSNYGLKIDLLLGELLIDLGRMAGEHGRSVDFTYILGFIDEHFNQPVDFNRLAELSGYSYHRFRHLFKKVTGQSPVGYILDKRLKSAALLLEQSKVPISEISHQCGFSNESQFAAMFKEYSGVTPSTYRKNNLP